MKVKRKIVSGICSLCFLFTLSTAQACYYEGDPVKTDSGYDVPQSYSDSECYYGGDPVLDVSGNYDTPTVMAEGAHVYMADLPEAELYSDTSEVVEFSAFEHETESEQTSITGIRSKERDLGDHEWAPATWSAEF